MFTAGAWPQDALTSTTLYNRTPEYRASEIEYALTSPGCDGPWRDT